LRRLNLDGDRQADLTEHGGEHKAVYCYSLAHYGYWKKELPGRELPMGMFGENFTIDDGGPGLPVLESWVCHTPFSACGAFDLIHAMPARVVLPFQALL